MIIGHEIAGEIISVGSRVHRLKIGDRVAVSPSRPCQNCSFCFDGQKNTAKICGFMEAQYQYPIYKDHFKKHLLPQNRNAI